MCVASVFDSVLQHDCFQFALLEGMCGSRHIGGSDRIAAMDVCDVTVKRCVSIEVPGQKPWLIDQTEVIDGIEYVAIRVRDTGYKRFMAGTYKKGREVAMTEFMRTLAKLRAEASIKSAGGDATAEMFADVEPTPAAKKKARKLAKLQGSIGTLPLAVQITCPALDLPDGSTIPQISFMVKSSVDIRDSPVVELTARVLHYIKVAINVSDDCEKPMREPCAAGTRWRKDRQCWLARRPGGASKCFKPTSGCELAVAETRDEALRWQEGGDCEIAVAGLHDGDDDGQKSDGHSRSDDDKESITVSPHQLHSGDCELNGTAGADFADIEITDMSA